MGRYNFISFETQLLDEMQSKGYGLQFKIFLEERSDEINRIYDLLADNLSRLVFERVISFRLTLDSSLIHDIFDPNIYFGNDVIPSYNGEAFIDCGAFTGDTLIDFNARDNCECSIYHALEPSDDNFQDLLKNIKKYGIEYARAHKTGVWSVKKDLSFSKNSGIGDRICEYGELRISVDAIDNLFEGQAVGFIKMDIEGAEEEAIRGAMSTIKKQKPILAVSAYHKPADIWEVPALIQKIGSCQFDSSRLPYRIFLRHHSRHIDDTVCYAVS
jgi:FkbM family methyltransferase